MFLLSIKKAIKKAIKKTQQKEMFMPFLLVFGILFSDASLAGIGKVIYEHGDNYALDFDGNRRELKKGAEIEEGDTLVTGAGRMQVRLIDGGLISVYPNSEYKIEQFKFGSATPSTIDSNENASPVVLTESKTDRGFFNLLKGAARQVTGLLGRKYNGNFKFKSTIATVGIRGTGFFARICQADCFDKAGNPLQDGMYVKNNVGVITMANNAGVIALAQGQAAFAGSSEDAPVQTDESPAVSGDGASDEAETFDFDGSVFQGNSHISINDLNATNGATPPLALNNIDYAFNERADIGAATVGVINLDGVTNRVLQNGDEISGFKEQTSSSLIVFDKADATLEEKGLNANLGVMWNRWRGAYSLTKDGVAVASVDQDIHLIGTDQLTQSITNLAPKGNVEYIGRASATSPTLNVNGETLVGTQTFHAGLNFSGLSGGSGIELTHLNISTDFGDMKVNLHLDNRLDLTSASGVAEMHGHCRNCIAGLPETRMDGFSTINIVGNNAEGIFGSYNLTGEGTAISGSYVGSEATLR